MIYRETSKNKIREERLKENLKKPKFQEIMLQSLAKGNKVEVEADSDGSIKIVKHAVYGVEKV